MSAPSTYEETLLAKPRAAAFDRWCTRLTWMILAASLVAVFSLVGLSMEPLDRLSSGLVVAAAWSTVSVLAAFSLLAARLVLAALRDAELDS